MHNDSTVNPVSQAQLLQLHGEDARAFASSQLASRVDQLDREHWQWTAWLDAGGKVRFVGMVWLEDECLRIVLRGGCAHALRQAMSPFVLRSKVIIETDDHAHLQPGSALPHGQLDRDESTTVFGFGDYSLSLATRAATASADAWRDCTLRAIAAGHPWLPDAALDRLLPPALGLHRLGAVALGKGCYPGQEMVNRLHHRGKHKYALAHVATGQHWQPGHSLRHDEQNVGTVLQRAGNDALIVLREGALDKLEKTTLVRQFSA